MSKPRDNEEVDEEDNNFKNLNKFIYIYIYSITFCYSPFLDVYNTIILITNLPQDILIIITYTNFVYVILCFLIIEERKERKEQKEMNIKIK